MKKDDFEQFIDTAFKSDVFDVLWDTDANGDSLRGEGNYSPLDVARIALFANDAGYDERLGLLYWLMQNMFYQGAKRQRERQAKVGKLLLDEHPLTFWSPEDPELYG